MAEVSHIFLAAEADPQVKPLTRDGRAALLFDRTGTRLLWANAAGAALLGIRSVQALADRRFPASGATARRLATIAGQLSGGAEKTERLPLPTGIVPVQVVCRASRLVVDAERAILLLVTDDTGRIASSERAEALYDALTRSLRQPAAPEAAPEPAPAEAVLPEDVPEPGVPADTGAEAERGEAAAGRPEASADDAQAEAGDQPVPASKPDDVPPAIGQPAEAEPADAVEPVAATEPDAVLQAGPEGGPPFEAPAAPIAPADADQSSVLDRPFEAPPETGAEVASGPSAATAESGLPDAEDHGEESVPAPDMPAPDDATDAPSGAATDVRMEDEAGAPAEAEAGASAGPDERPEADAPADPEAVAGEALRAEPETASQTDAAPEPSAPTTSATAEAPPPRAPAPDYPAFAFRAHGRTIRFVFELDPDLAFSFVSPELADTVGPRAADLSGRTWGSVAESFGLDPLGRIGAALARKDTFTGLTVDWPVEGAAMRVPLDLAGMPVFGRDRSFRGYRGFGMAKVGAAFPSEMVIGSLSSPAQSGPSDEPAAEVRDAADDGLAVEDAPALMRDIVPEIITHETVDAEPLDRREAIEEGLGADWAAEDHRDPPGPEDAATIDADASDAAAAPDEPDEPDQVGPEETTDRPAETIATGQAVPDRPADAAELADGDEGWSIDLDREFEFQIAVADAPALLLEVETDVIVGETPDDEPLSTEEMIEEDLGSEWAVGETAEGSAAPAEPAELADTGPVDDAGLAPAPEEETEGDADLADLAALDGLDADAVPAGDDDHTDEIGADGSEEPTPEDDAGRDDDRDEYGDAAGPLPDEAPGSVEPEDAEPAGPEPATGEVIMSPIVPRSIPARDYTEAEANRRQLSRPEREAFQKIAEALGARYEDPAPLAPVSPDPDLGGSDDNAPAGRSAAPARLPTGPIDPSVLDKLPIAIAILKDGEAVAVNRHFLDTADYPDWASLEAAGGFNEAFVGTAMPRDMSLPAIRRRDGVEIPVHARLHSIPWQDGIASLLVLQETAAATGRDRAQAAESRVEELEAILDTATDGVLVLDHRGTILGANRSAEALFGTERSSMIGEPIVQLLAPESHRDALDYLDGLGRNGVASVLNDGREVIGRVSQGGLVPLFMTIGRISPMKFCAVLRDITQWKRAEEELTNAKRSAENASSQKSDFLAKISHEIRTPLNAIIGFSEVMMEERFGPVGSDRYKEYLRDIHISGAHIMSLVNDLLDLSKIEAGKLDLSFEAVPLNEVIRECVALMQPQANRERIIIRTSLSSSLPDVVADSRSLRQIVLNLVSNAIKFNNAGGQVIVSTLYEDTGEVAVRVRDTGPGMSEDDLKKALEPFRQLQTARPGRGTGLGLPLTKALVEANRAGFRIDSTVGQGTLVQITFPSTRVLAE